jgi:hypothetical protein
VATLSLRGNSLTETVRAAERAGFMTLHRKEPVSWLLTVMGFPKYVHRS